MGEWVKGRMRGGARAYSEPRLNSLASKVERSADPIERCVRFGDYNAFRIGSDRKTISGARRMRVK